MIRQRWKLGDSATTIGGPKADVVILADDGRYVAHAHPEHASLIVAAPDLLTVAHQFASILDELVAVPEANAKLRALRARVHVAIAKAEGT